MNKLVYNCILNKRTKLKCKTCGAIGAAEGMLPECTNCYEVESRLAEYLQSDKGKQFVLALLVITSAPTA